MNRFRISSIAIAVAAATSLVACEEVAPDRTAGQKLDQTIESTRHSMFDVGKKVETQAGNAAKVVKGAGDAVGVGAVAVGSAIDDAAIVASINADLLKDSGLGVLKVDVDSREGVVTLNGMAATQAARERAGKLASAIKGVHEVRNYLVVKRS